jgi:hypothetical protein
MGRDEDGPVLELDATRQGSRSVYGEFRVTKPGQATPIVVQKGIAIYPEIGKRKVDLPTQRRGGRGHPRQRGDHRLSRHA